MRTTIRSYVKGSVQNNLREYNPEKTYKVEMITRKTDDEIIAEQIVKAEKEKKEKELLEAQLKLPPSKRSEELMRKYNLSVASDTSLIDNYNGTTGVPTNYEIYYPEDVAVKDLRPSNHLVAIEGVSDSSEDKFSFYFHVSINESTPGTFDYKVDGMTTYVDKEYKLLAKGEFDLYKALYFYKMKDKSYRNEIMKVFKKYGIVANNSKVLFGKGAKVDLKIKGLGMKVTHQPLGIKDTEVKEEPKVKEESFDEFVDRLVVELGDNLQPNGTDYYPDYDMNEEHDPIEFTHLMETTGDNKYVTEIQVDMDGSTKNFNGMKLDKLNIFLSTDYKINDDIIRALISPKSYAVIDLNLLEGDEIEFIINTNNEIVNGTRKGIQNTKVSKLINFLRRNQK